MSTKDGEKYSNFEILGNEKPKGEVVAVVIEHDDDGWWAYYSAGWCSGSDFMGASHQDHEDTKREIMKAVRSALKCTCEKCKAEAIQC